MYVLEEPERLSGFLEGRLPRALPVYGAIKSSSPIKAWTTLTLNSKEFATEPWVVIVLLLPPSHDQYRIYCSADHEEVGVQLVLDALTQLVLEKGTMLGALEVRWALPVIQRFVQGGTGRASRYNVWLSNDDGSGVELRLGYELDHGREEDIAEMVATSDIPRSAAYLRSLLSQTSVVREQNTGQAVAWVISHADNSLGTLFTLSTHRRRGLAKAVVQHRLSHSQTRGFAYVSEGNEASEGVWNGLGWSVGWQVYWVVTNLFGRRDEYSLPLVDRKQEKGGISVVEDSSSSTSTTERKNNTVLTTYQLQAPQSMDVPGIHLLAQAAELLDILRAEKQPSQVSASGFAASSSSGQQHASRTRQIERPLEHGLAAKLLRAKHRRSIGFLLNSTTAGPQKPQVPSRDELECMIAADALAALSVCTSPCRQSPPPPPLPAPVIVPLIQKTAPMAPKQVTPIPLPFHHTPLLIPPTPPPLPSTIPSFQLENPVQPYRPTRRPVFGVRRVSLPDRRKGRELDVVIREQFSNAVTGAVADDEVAQMRENAREQLAFILLSLSTRLEAAAALPLKVAQAPAQQRERPAQVLQARYKRHRPSVVLPPIPSPNSYRPYEPSPQAKPDLPTPSPPLLCSSIGSKRFELPPSPSITPSPEQLHAQVNPSPASGTVSAGKVDDPVTNLIPKRQRSHDDTLRSAQAPLTPPMSPVALRKAVRTLMASRIRSASASQSPSSMKVHDPSSIETAAAVERAENVESLPASAFGRTCAPMLLPSNTAAQTGLGLYTATQQLSPPLPLLSFSVQGKRARPPLLQIPKQHSRDDAQEKCIKRIRSSPVLPSALRDPATTRQPLFDVSVQSASKRKRPAMLLLLDKSFTIERVDDVSSPAKPSVSSKRQRPPMLLVPAENIMS